MQNILEKYILLVFVVLSLSWMGSAQVATGMPPFSSLGGGPFDTVNLGNNNVHFAIPVIHKKGRAGFDFNYDLTYDNSIWYPVTSNGVTSWQPVSNWGWAGLTAPTTGYVTYTSTNSGPACYFSGTAYGQQYTQANWTYVDSFGAVHNFSGTTLRYVGAAAYCPPDTSMTSTTNDGSGWTLSATGINLRNVKSISGQTIYPFVNGAGTSASKVDANGNIISVNNNSFYDTLSATTPVLTIAGSGTSASPYQLGYIPPANVTTGARVYVKVNFVNYTLKTSFGAKTNSGSTIKEYSSTSAIPLVDSISLPDGTQYNFKYEATSGSCTLVSGTSACVTGRLIQVTLPTGGTIKYAYSGGSNGIFNDGSAATLSRTLNPGGTWTYARSQVSGSHWQTLLTDASVTPNQTLIDFWGIYETQRLVYQGKVSGTPPGTLLRTTITCYNNSNPTPSTCLTTGVSGGIGERMIFTYLPDSSGLQSKTDTLYTSIGLITSEDDYDYKLAAPGSWLRRISTFYGTYSSSNNGCIALGNGVFDHVCEVDVATVGADLTSKTLYSYDESTPTPTSGTPQHSVGANAGNLTTLIQQVNTNNPITKLYRKFTYYDTGTLNTSTDVSTSNTTNGPTTTYHYSSSSCGNSFATSMDGPLGTHSFSWDCTGGVMTRITDENGSSSQTLFTGTNTNCTTSADAFFWRPYCSIDPLQNATLFSYGTKSYESNMSFNSNKSAVDSLIQIDGLGSPVNFQSQQQPGGSNYDTATLGYDSNGRQVLTTMPCTVGSGAACPSSPGVNTQYDALNRPIQVQNATGTMMYKYDDSQNRSTIDVLQTLVTTGGNSKQKQLQYDSLGRVASVCEITSGTTQFPAGNCAQTVPQTGYWTKYSYNNSSKLTGVTQNAQGSATQTRNYGYDLLGRMISEQNPESGTTSYIYDSEPSCGPNGSYSSAGDLLQTTDAAGNHICYYYDALHRLTNVGNSNQGSTNVCRRFRYDNSSGVLGSRPSGVTITNGIGHLIEAETDTCASPITQSSIITDEWFSYDAKGRTTDIYESTPHSNGYYDVKATYWADGALNTLQGVGLPILTYGIDGEGRPSTVSASAGVNPVYSTMYNAAGQATDVTFGTTSGPGDLVHFGFDSNGRMNKFQLTINGTALHGDPQWNPNGTLGSLTITDPFNLKDVQTCNYGYDDLARLASVDCGASIWQQNFTYDPFGNITKNVPNGSAGLSFQPGYNEATNQYTNGATYDPNGNLTNDGTDHVYTWDVYGDPVTLDSFNLIYDALGRQVEKQNGSSYVETVYGPAGKLALMNGQAQIKAFVPLPGGTQVKYAGSSISTYRLPDWLGSFRAGSNPDRTYSWGIAFAPFGEQYAVSGGPAWSFTGEQGTADTVSDEYDFVYRKLHSAQGRWISPDPAGFGAVNPQDPQTWNRYAYVANSPLTSTDPSGLCDPTRSPFEEDGCPTLQPWLYSFDPSCAYTLAPCTLAYIPPWLGRNTTVSKVYRLTTTCNSSADQVMQTVESNFSTFGNFSRLGGRVTFSPPPSLSVGSTIPIKVGILGINQNLSVNVESVTAGHMTFTTNPGHLLFPAYITFAAGPASPGSIDFNISLGGTIASQIEFDFGGGAFEDAQWNHFLGQVTAFCKAGK
jgi:RHS repeat-associated protein